MKLNAKTATVVGSSVAVGFIGDLLIYSLAESKGKKFGIHMPKGWALVNLIALGIVTGLVIDYAVGQMENLIKNKQERELADLVEKEEAKIASGALAGKDPKAVLWT